MSSHFKNLQQLFLMFKSEQTNLTGGINDFGIVRKKDLFLSYN